MVHLLINSGGSSYGTRRRRKTSESSMLRSEEALLYTMAEHSPGLRRGGAVLSVTSGWRFGCFVRVLRLVLAVEIEFTEPFQSVFCFRRFSEIGVLTCFGVWDYKPLTNEGGGAAGDDVLRSREIIEN